MAETNSIRDSFLPKYVRIKQELTEEIRAGRLAAGSRVPSEAELMKTYGVSRMTANRALREAADEGFVVRVQGHGTYVAEQPPATVKGIEFVYVGARVGIYPELLAGVETRARELGYRLVLSGAEWDLDGALQHVTDTNWEDTCGVIYRPIESSIAYVLNKEIVQTLWEKGIPVVCVDNYVGLSDKESCVISDNFAKARALTLELARAGYRRIGFVGGPDCSSQRDRLAGYRHALEESGIPFDEGLVDNLDHRQPASDGIDDVLDTFLVTGRMDAIFCLNDYTALSIISACRRRHLELPDEIAVVGYDDMEFAEGFDLTTVRQPLREEGRVAMDCLRRLMDGETTPQRIVLPGTLMRRKLTGHLSAPQPA